MSSTQSSLENKVDSVNDSLNETNENVVNDTTNQEPVKIKKKRGRKPKPKTDQPPKIPKTATTTGIVPPSLHDMLLQYRSNLFSDSHNPSPTGFSLRSVVGYHACAIS